jgi:hypothetical protein
LKLGQQMPLDGRRFVLVELDDRHSTRPIQVIVRGCADYEWRSLTVRSAPRIYERVRKRR